MKTIRIFALFALLCCAAMTARAQSDLKARMEYEKAEEAYSQERYEAALTHLNATEKLLANYAPRIAHLKIITLDKLCDYYGKDNDPRLKELSGCVTAYMKHCEKHPKDVVMEKFREVYAIEEKIALAREGGNNLSPEQLVEKFDAAVRAGNRAEALMYCKALAARGNAVAMSNLGTLYYEGTGGVEKNVPEAIGWYEKAAAQGNVEAMWGLGTIYLNDNKTQQGLGWMEKAAMGGKAEAAYYAGLLCYNADDTANALKWFEKAAQNGNTDAMYYTGVLYDAQKNPASALKWYVKAAQNGNVDAMYSAAMKYYYNDPAVSGLAKKEAKQKAKEWFGKAAAKGHEESKKILVLF